MAKTRSFVERRDTTQPGYWRSHVSRRFRRNAIELHRRLAEVCDTLAKSDLDPARQQALLFDRNLLTDSIKIFAAASVETLVNELLIRDRKHECANETKQFVGSNRGDRPMP